jgi:uncharacterized protein (DUF1697 family)
MPSYVALLRAINVGGRIVKMERLRELFEEIGFRNVATFIASGNVIFESPAKDAAKLERRIEKHLEKSLGFAVATFLRTPPELSAITSFEPFPEEDTSRGVLSVAFLAQPPDVELAGQVGAFRTELDRFRVEGREVYWYCRTRISESKAPIGYIEKALRAPATVRNITTVRRLASRWEA